MKIKDLMRDPQQPWMYPFSKVKKDTVEGFYIDWDEEPGLIIDPELVSVGDLISDVSLNAEPYWVVTQVVDHLIYVNLHGANPFLTGVGAGGARIGDLDWKVLTGEAEQSIVDRILEQIQTEQYADYRDVSYLLLGANPYRFGPNGVEGGWYALTSWSSRGSQKGMSPVEIMVSDAETLQKLGLEVPETALTGTLDPYTWSKLVGGDRDRTLGTELPSENWNDALQTARVVLTHPQPQIRYRNAALLIDLARNWSSVVTDLDFLTNQLPSIQDDSPEAIEQRRRINKEQDIVRHRWRTGEYGDPELLELARDLSLRLVEAEHPTYKAYDVYYLTKEKFIQLATDMCWLDVLHAYQHAPDPTNRRYAVYGLQACGQIQALLEVISTETHPEVLAAAVRGLEKSDRELLITTLEDNRDALYSFTREDQDESLNYYRGELRKTLDNLFRKIRVWEAHSFWPKY